MLVPVDAPPQRLVESDVEVDPQIPEPVQFRSLQEHAVGEQDRVVRRDARRIQRTGPLDPPQIAPDDAILLADGVFLQRPELDRFWDLRIYLDIGFEESLRRGVDRDQHWMGGAAEAEGRYRTKYLPGEQRYLAEVRPRERAQIVVDTSDPGRPRIMSAR